MLSIKTRRVQSGARRVAEFARLKAECYDDQVLARVVEVLVFTVEPWEALS